jgi:hypothetical protein
MFMRSNFVAMVTSKTVVSLKLIQTKETGQTHIQKEETRISLTYYTVILANFQKTYNISVPDFLNSCFIHKLIKVHSMA